MVQILSVPQLRNLNKIGKLEDHKALLKNAVLKTNDPLEKERLQNQVLRVNSVLNEYRPLEGAY